MKDNQIDWEKLLAYLDAKENNKLKELSEEEANIFLFADEVRYELSGEQLKDEFSLAEGLREILKRKKRRKLRQFIAYSAAIIAFVGIALWVAVRNQDTAPAASNPIAHTAQKNIKLHRSNGEEVLIGTGTKNLQENGGEISIVDNQISYTETNSADAKTSNIMNTVDVPRGLRTKIVLTDGTQVWVNSETSIRYPVPFRGDTREVYIKGEAYFDVAHNASKPFIVHSGDLRVHVLGTAFGINTFNNDIKTALVRGSVELQTNKQKQRLSPGEVGQYNTQSAKLSLSGEDIRSLVAWKDNILYFDRVDLAEITAQLGRTYDYEFVFDNPELKKLGFTMDIPRSDDIQTVLQFLKMSMPEVDFKIRDRKIHLNSVK